jgi:hypothetical protein
MTLAKDEMKRCSILGHEPIEISFSSANASDTTGPGAIQIMKAYLLLKLEQGDYHAVCDAAMDLREMVAKGKGC